MAVDLCSDVDVVPVLLICFIEVDLNDVPVFFLIDLNDGCFVFLNFSVMFVDEVPVLFLELDGVGSLEVDSVVGYGLDLYIIDLAISGDVIIIFCCEVYSCDFDIEIAATEVDATFCRSCWFTDSSWTSMVPVLVVPTSVTLHPVLVVVVGSESDSMKVLD